MFPGGFAGTGQQRAPGAADKVPRISLIQGACSMHLHSEPVSYRPHPLRHLALRAGLLLLLHIEKT